MEEEPSALYEREKKTMPHVCKSNCVFERFRREYTFADSKEAGEALKPFLEAIEGADEALYPLAFRDALAHQCRSVLSSLASLQVPLLLENETNEWLITTTGVALIRVRYNLESAEDGADWIDGECPCDYQIETLVSCEGAYCLTVEAAGELLGEPPEMVAGLLWDLPSWYYIGTADKPEAVRLSVNAVLYLVGEHGDYETPWVTPQLRATKAGYRLK